ncbi:MAG: hypothetical protein NTX33_05910 [Propionibacteriales bacterium]|nr:hypothetical protein [Propionibacteriales bacterium]
MNVLETKIVCDRCSRLLARMGYREGSGWGLAVRRHAILDHSPADEPRVTFDCPKCHAHIVVKLATLHRRADDERIIAV